VEERFELVERPTAKEMYMIAGWEQWADAGEISSALPRYLTKLTDARKIGEIVDKHPTEALSIIRAWMYQET